MADDPEAHRAPPPPRSQRNATGLSTELQLCCAKLRAEGYDVVHARTLLDQDRELERYRVAEAAGGFRVAAADAQDDVERCRALLGTLTVYVERCSHELPDRRAATTLLEDLDAELAAVGFRRREPGDPAVGLLELDEP